MFTACVSNGLADGLLPLILRPSALLSQLLSTSLWITEPIDPSTRLLTPYRVANTSFLAKHTISIYIYIYPEKNSRASIPFLIFEDSIPYDNTNRKRARERKEDREAIGILALDEERDLENTRRRHGRGDNARIRASSRPIVAFFSSRDSLASPRGGWFFTRKRRAHDTRARINRAERGHDRFSLFVAILRNRWPTDYSTLSLITLPPDPTADYGIPIANLLPGFEIGERSLFFCIPAKGVQTVEDRSLLVPFMQVRKREKARVRKSCPFS